MFTGIVTDIGKIIELEKRGDLRARIQTDYDINTIAIGASIACDGICLTVIKTGSNWFDVEISAESVQKTHLKFNTWVIGAYLNLERALRVGDELGGHLVSGHVDGLDGITAITPAGDSHVVWLEGPQAVAKFVAPKGSVALDGVSLTVNAVKGSAFSLNIIQHSWDVTGWGQAVVGQKMNMEIDMLARYVARLAAFDKD